MAKRKILVVDDELQVCQLLQDILEQNGFAVTACHTTDEAFARMKNGLPDLIILDLRLPTIGGLEFCRQVRRDATLQVKAIMMLSSLEHGVQAAQCRELGIGAYLVKPVRQEQLFDALLLALGRICASPAAWQPGSAASPAI